MAISDEFLNELRERTDIESLISQYVNLSKRGRNPKGLCPFHNEKTPSCHVHPDKEYFHGFGCGAGGDVITFTMKYHNLDYWEAVKMLAERGGVPLPEDNGYNSRQADNRKRMYEMNKTAARFFYNQLRSNDGRQCLEYLIKVRRLTPETIKKYGMGFAPNSWTALKNHMLSEGFTEQELEAGSLISRSQKNTQKTFDFFVNRAMFPFFDLAGHIVGFGGRALSDDDKRKYLNSKDTLVYSKNRFLFSMNFAKNAAVKNRTILLCEGNLDVISLNQAGFENAVASCGTALTSEQAKIISNYADNVVICYDSDGAGQKATSRAIGILDELGLKTTVIKMTGAKDPDEYIHKYSPEHFRHLLNNSDGAINFELDKCREGIDTSNELGKIDYLKKAYKVLASVKSPVERDVYISKISLETGISRNAITEEINSIMKKERYAYNKKDWNRTVTFSNRKRDDINPEAFSHPKEAFAESGIIYYLYTNHDVCEELTKKLPPQNFVTNFNKRLYESLTQKIKNCEDCSISAFNGEFSPEEVGKLTEIIDKFDVLSVDSAVAEDYIRVINGYSEKNKKTDFSDDDFISRMEKLKKDKKG